MKLSEIQIQNFKTFKDLSLTLDDINLFIGSCASGKSNFVEVFDFAKDLSQDFEKAVSKHGGRYVKNLNVIDEYNPICLKFSFENKSDNLFLNLANQEDENNNITVSFNGFRYEISFDFHDWDCEILNETVSFDFEIVNSKEVISQNTLILVNDRGQFSVKFEKSENLIALDELIPNSLIKIAENNFKLNNIALINSPLASVPFPWAFVFKDIECYNLNPQFSKGIAKINGDAHLLKFGENLPVILNKIFENKEDKRKFLNLLNDLLPYIEDVNVNQLSDNQMFFSLTENENVELPSFFISDGTINIISLLVCLYFDDSKFLFIEEPERNIHPALLSKFVQMLEEASQSKQIVITTHSPEILKFINLNDVYFISKDENDFSKVSKPVNNRFIKPFIDEFGIDEVFVDNYLEYDDE